MTFYCLCSCALLVDFDIHIWDMRRPYIPYATFSEHKDVPTGKSNHGFTYLCGDSPCMYGQCALSNSDTEFIVIFIQQYCTDN